MLLRRASALIATTLALIVLATMATPVGAASVLYSSGTQGRWKITDDSANPSFRCIYENADPYDGSLTKIRVWPAKVWGTTSTSRRVGWRFTVAGQADHQGSWVDLYTSPWQFSTATTTTRASFAPMTWVPNEAIVNGNSYWDFNVTLTVAWYGRTSKIGQIILGLDYYRFLSRWDNEVLAAPCSSVGYFF